MLWWVFIVLPVSHPEQSSFRFMSGKCWKRKKERIETFLKKKSWGENALYCLYCDSTMAWTIELNTLTNIFRKCVVACPLVGVPGQFSWFSCLRLPAHQLWWKTKRYNQWYPLASNSELPSQSTKSIKLLKMKNMRNSI